MIWQKYRIRPFLPSFISRALPPGPFLRGKGVGVPQQAAAAGIHAAGVEG
jgi:hypothetical protein